MASVVGPFPAEKSLKSLGAARCKVSQQPLSATATAPSCTRMFPIATSRSCSKMVFGFAFHCQPSLSACLKRLSDRKLGLLLRRDHPNPLATLGDLTRTSFSPQ